MSPRLLARWLPNRTLIGDEQVIVFTRRHWFVLVTKYLFMLLLALVPLVAYILFKNVFTTFDDNDIGRAVVILLAGAYYLFIWVSLFTIFIDYYFDLWIVTTHRIIDVEQKGLFNHQVSEQSLESVQDVQSLVKGILPTLLDYGNVTVQTAGARNLFEFKQVPMPAMVARQITKLAEEYRNEHTHPNNPQ